MRNKQLKIGAIISYLTIVFNIITGLIYTPWVLRAIGDDDYSIYTVATSLIAIFMMDFGISSSISKFVSKYIAENRQEEIDNFMGVVYKLYLIIDSNFAHRFCLCTLKIQYLAVIQLSKVCCYAA